MSNPGYTDEVAEECHDLIDRAEEDAHLHDDDMMSSGQPMGQKMKKKSGLESENTESSMKNEGSSSMKEPVGSMKEMVGKTMDQMKDTMGMKK